MEKTFGKSRAADSLCKILDEQGSKWVTTKVSRILHAFNKTMKDLEDINNNTLYLRCSTIILKNAESEIEKLKGDETVRSHCKNVIRTTYREGLRNRGIIEARKNV